MVACNENVDQEDIDRAQPFIKYSPDRATAALALICRYGGIDGDHHKAWVLDQITRTLTAEYYDEYVKAMCDGEDGPETYSWDVGIQP